MQFWLAYFTHYFTHILHITVYKTKNIVIHIFIYLLIYFNAFKMYNLRLYINLNVSRSDYLYIFTLEHQTDNQKDNAELWYLTYVTLAHKTSHK